MDDIEIIELYWRRSQEAICQTDVKYGGMCRGISYNILASTEDSEKRVSDTYMALWQRMPPERPGRLGAFIAAIVRNISLKRLRHRLRQKRGGGEAVLALDELEDWVASGSNVEKIMNIRSSPQLLRFLCALFPERSGTFSSAATGFFSLWRRRQSVWVWVKAG